MKPHSLDFELLSSYINYDKDSGSLTWSKKPCSRILVGSPVGCAKSKSRPYVVFRLFGKNYLGHRVAWCLHTRKDIPVGMEIDHVNGDHSDNRICNLRLATPRQNKANINSKVGKSGVRGVIWDKVKKKWRAQISNKNKCIWLGNFDSIEDAKSARMVAEKEMQGVYSYYESRGNA